MKPSLTFSSNQCPNSSHSLCLVKEHARTLAFICNYKTAILKPCGLAGLLLYLILIFSVHSFAQHHPLTYKASIFNEGTTLPFTKGFSKPLHIGLQAGLEIPYFKKSASQLYQSVNLGYYFHKHLNQAGYINIGIGYDYHLPFGLKTKAIFSLSYLRSFSVQDQYVLEKGQYVLKNDRGKSRLAAAISMGIGYRIHPKRASSPEIFALYEPWVEYPYAPGFIPVMPHLNFHIGAAFQLTK
jgi:hypothetical protein